MTLATGKNWVKSPTSRLPTVPSPPDTHSYRPHPTLNSAYRKNRRYGLNSQFFVMVLLCRLQQERIGLKVPLPGYPALQTPTAAAFTQRWIQPTKSYEMKVKFTIQQERMGLKVPLPGYPALQTPTDTSLTERWIQPTTEYIRDNRFQDTQPSIGRHPQLPPSPSVEINLPKIHEMKEKFTPAKGNNWVKSYNRSYQG